MNPLAALAFLIPCITAHICLHKPRPIPGSDLKDCAPTRLRCGLQATFSSQVVESWTAGATATIQWRKPGVYGNRDQPNYGDHQARHGGGISDISLKYANGSSFRTIVRFVRNFPDVTIDGVISLPRDLPDGIAIMSWSWIPALGGRPEFFSNCALIRIVNPRPSHALSVDQFERQYCAALDKDIGWRPPSDGHGNSIGDGWDKRFVNYATCGPDGVFGIEDWKLLFEGQGAAHAGAAALSGIEEPDVMAPDAGKGEQGMSRSPNSANDSEIKTVTSTMIAAEPNPGLPSEAKDGSCDVTLSTHYCRPDTVTTHFYQCLHGALKAIPLAPGTRCVCKGIGVSSLCPMSHLGHL